MSMCRGGAHRQLLLLLWKNALIQWRSKLWTIFELGLPIALASLLLVVRLVPDDDIKTPAEEFQPFAVVGGNADLHLPREWDGTMLSMINTDCYGATNGLTLYYAPDNSETRQLAKDVIAGYRNNFTIEGFKTEQEMIGALTAAYNGFNSTIRSKDSCRYGPLGGIYFSSWNGKVARYSIRLKDKQRTRIYHFEVAPKFEPLRWNTKMFAIPSSASGLSQHAFGSKIQTGGPPEYWMEGFLSFQRAIDRALTVKNVPSPGDNITTNLQRIPFPAVKTNIRIMAVGIIFPYVMFFALYVTLFYMIRHIIAEKEAGLKEYMKVMGLSGWMHWLAYYLTYMIKMVLITVYSVFIAKMLLSGADATVLFVLFMLYASNVIYFAFFVSTLFHSANLATAFAAVSWFVLQLIPPLLNTKGNTLLLPQMLNCLNINHAFRAGLDLVSLYEAYEGGIGWSLLFTRLSIDNPMTMGHLFTMFLVDLVLLALLTGYVEAINPGSLGVAEQPWFPFMPSYWCPSRLTTVSSDDVRTREGTPPGTPNYATVPDRRSSEIDIDMVGEHSSGIEPEPEGMQPDLEVKRLTKVWNAGMWQTIKRWLSNDDEPEIRAVDDLSFNAYPGQVTALLGHNGAGKSTTFAMLTGMTSPTGGRAVISGYDCRTGMTGIRRRLGLCPQHNILFDDLTVAEHLKFFCKLKGRPFDENETRYLLNSLGIADKMHSLAKSLSGGMKRKLSLAMALVGGSEVVILDEPTSGMDPNARHDAWKLVQEAKKDRTILLTTHYMEEADLLGDRIAILAKGKLQCCGTGMFLKNHYGTGYHLTTVFEAALSAERQTDAASETLRAAQNHCSDAIKLEWMSGADASFLLPVESRNRFGELFDHLEKNKSNLSIQSFGVSVTTMEEVFLRVGKLADGDATAAEARKLVAQQSSVENLEGLACSEPLTGGALFLQQMKAMFIKRLIYFYRRWGLIVLQVVIPLCLLLFVLLLPLLNIGSDVTTPDPPRDLSDLNAIRGSSVLWQLKKPASDNANKLAETYRKLCESSGMNLEEIPADENITTFMLAKYRTGGFLSTNSKYVLGASVKDTEPRGLAITGFFNNELLHTAAMSLNLIDDAVRIYSKGESDSRIVTVNHPVPPQSLPADHAEATPRDINAEVLLPVYAFALSLLSAGYVVNLVRERAIRAKHMQLMTGLHPISYWFSNFVFDVLLYSVVALLSVAMLYIFDVKMVTANSQQWRLLGSLYSYAWATLPLVYCWSFLFRGPIKAMIFLFLLILVGGVLIRVLISVLSQSPNVDVKFWKTVCYLLFPIYGFVDTFPSNKATHQGHTSTSPPKEDDKDADWSFVVIAMLCEGLLYWALVFAVEFDLFRKLAYAVGCARKTPGWFNWYGQNQPTAVVEKDSDVQAETELVNSTAPDNAALIARGLTKFYGQFCAVNSVHFHAMRGECFGLLGVNGAGKTSTFQMLTGENLISDGDAYVAGISVKDHWRQAGKRIGYCPQFDAVVPDLTGGETLAMYGRIRGVPEPQLIELIKRTVAATGIRPHVDKLAKAYSGGNRRRLSLGAALIGLPDVLMLDEPTAGVDPAARRTVWDCLTLIRQQGRSVVLTSHSMEECEALCTRLAIMVAGQFVCMGSPQHLKNKFGAGYTLQVKATSLGDVEGVQQAITREFPGSICKEVFNTQMTFEIRRTTDMRWSLLFSKMEDLNRSLNLVDYSLSQTTLEQIFLDFSKHYAPAQLPTGFRPQVVAAQTL